MNKQDLFKKFLPHLIAMGVILVVMFAYFSPLFSGKVLKQHDIMQWKASYEEIANFEKNSGERTFWTNSMFAGMPSYLIGASYYYNASNEVYKVVNKIFGNPLETVFLLYVCFYVLLLVFEVNPWFAIIGALAFTFSSFNFINIDAGHAGKGNAIALMPLVLAGVKLTLGNKKLIGALLTGIALSLQLAAGHLQITYYLALIIGAWILVELVLAITENKMANLIKSGAFLIVAAMLAVGSNITNLLVTEEYGKYSIRGQSELTPKTAEGNPVQNAEKSTGLDHDYALQWSNGVTEPFTLLIPNFLGGGNVGDEHTQEIMAKSFKSDPQLAPQAKQIAQGIPSYFGDQPFTAGPIYYGAIICFLFVLGMFVVKGPEKWWIFGISFLAIFLSMGRNFMSLTDLFFYNFPLYNKFRSVTFILAIAQTLFPLLGLLAIRDIVKAKVDVAKLKKQVIYSLAIVGGLCLIFALMPNITSVEAEHIDNQLKQYNLPLDPIYEARAAVRQMDALRSLFFILLAFGAIWLYLIGKLKQQFLALALGILVLVDLWGVDKRYLNNSDYEKRKKTDAVVAKTQADEIILQDKDPHYRVYNTTQRLDQDALTSYYHKSIGGYHGAKMRRYQDVVDMLNEELMKSRNILSERNMEVYNMLNVKYFIAADSANNLFAQLNPTANGNAWFVKKYELVDNADAEYAAIHNFNSKETCFIDKRFADEVKELNLEPDSNSTIKLTIYQPNKLVYESNTTADKLAVFSEVFYDKGWNAYVDGTLVPHFRCDYILRGMKVPAGKHTIEFKFEPKAVETGERVTLVSSILLYGGLVLVLLFNVFKKKKEQA